MNSKDLKYYFAQILIRIGEYETYTTYYFRTSGGIESAEREVKELYNVDGEDDERVAELVSVCEVSPEEYEVLRKYT